LVAVGINVEFMQTYIAGVSYPLQQVIWIMVFYWLDVRSMALPLFVSHTSHTGSSRIHGVQCGETMATTRFAVVMVSGQNAMVFAVSVATGI